MDRLTALQVFRRVAERGSFADAGRSLGLSPAAISKNIAELEAHVGTRLIQRTTRRMALTEEGRLYLEHVTRALDALADAQREALTLAYFGGYSQSEIAVLTGAPLGTIKTRMRDGLSRLRNEMG